MSNGIDKYNDLMVKGRHYIITKFYYFDPEPPVDTINTDLLRQWSGGDMVDLQTYQYPHQYQNNRKRITEPDTLPNDHYKKCKRN